MLSFWRQFFFFKMPVCGGIQGLKRGGVGCSSNIAPLLADAPPSSGRKAGTDPLGNSLVIYWGWGLGRKGKMKTKELKKEKKDKNGVIVTCFITPAPASPSKKFHSQDLGL